MKPALLSAALLFLVPIQTVAQPTWIEETRYVYDPGLSPDGLGESVSISGARAILGAPAVGVAGFSAGYAVVVEHEGMVWGSPQRLEADDGNIDDEFGRAVDIYNSSVVVGAPEADFEGLGTGAAYVFGLDNDVWTQLHRLVPDDSTGGLAFGTSVAVRDNFVLVGAPDINIGDLETGEAYVFELANGSVDRIQRLQYGDFSFVARFGESVALSDSLAVIGTPNRGAGSQNFGSVYLYQRSETEWEFLDELQADDAQAQDVFGSSVSVDGEWLFVGAPGEDDVAMGSGAVYVFRDIDGTWTQSARLKAPAPIADDAFGQSIDVSGTNAVVGTSRNDEMGGGAGTLYVFEFNGENWGLVEQLFASDAGIGDNLGASAAIDGDVIVAGAAGHNGDEAEESVGAAYFFRYDPEASSIDDDGTLVDAPFAVELFPNPVRETAILRITVRRSEHIRASLYDILGRKIRSLENAVLGPSRSHEILVPMADLANGLYFVKVEGGTMLESKLLVHGE